MIGKLEEHVLTFMPLKDWAERINEINESYTDYLLRDNNFIGNTDAASQITSIRALRDFFKEAAEL